jgi:hypothetical protein
MTTARARSHYHHGDLESALISTARKLVRQDGAEHLSLRQVSQEIGVSLALRITIFPIEHLYFQDSAFLYLRS